MLLQELTQPVYNRQGASHGQRENRACEQMLELVPEGPKSKIWNSTIMYSTMSIHKMNLVYARQCARH